MNQIVFVCTGNTCRSPMAKIIAENMIGSVSFDSAGIFASEGDSMAPYAREVLKKKDYKIGSFRSKRLHSKLIEEADLILTMTKEQKEVIHSFFGEHSQKVCTLKEYTADAEESTDIPDPFGRSLGAYMETAADIEEEIKKLRRKLVKRYGIE